MSNPIPLLAPVYLPGQEPLPPGIAPEEIQAWRQAQQYQKWIGYVPESCPFKVVLSGGAGFALGGFFSLMSATFAYEDPLSRASSQMANQGTKAQTIFVMKEMGRNMWSSGKGFAKVGALFSAYECAIEGYRAKNDHWNGLAGGFCAGATLARSSGIVGMLGGGAAFAAFSGAIEWYLRKAPADTSTVHGWIQRSERPG
ncbi:mitochondrial import inner membrane translocase subunit TIM22 [Papiliotrema laurentii]|uniref:Mitochondrial import inner membrane translocase subunit TIM22 n=1 Tax=Papiliotrema laurentii TaxID=5418 RepID=A0AAD9FVD7_PAPLA|nr:mitochondrial import inner membrane translocase subunit TIM22 [Papiliotrema laurentii]